MKKISFYARYLIFGLTLVFLGKTLIDRWQEVVAIRLNMTSYLMILAGLLLTLIGHIWSGWVWGWILREFQQKITNFWAIQIYLKTNIYKYLPGNVWHFYGRIKESQSAGIPSVIATITVLLEPLLMAAAALLIGIGGSQIEKPILPLGGLIAILIGIHPKILNLVVQITGKTKIKKAQQENLEVVPNIPIIKRYPLLPFLGELGFVLWRGAGFLLILLAFTPIELNQIPQIFSAFSWAWLLGLIVPGAPGGVGVFEATAIALLKSQYSIGLILGTVAVYRFVSILAEAMGATLAWYVVERKN